MKNIIKPPYIKCKIRSTSPRARSLIFTRSRPKGFKVVSYGKCCVELRTVASDKAKPVHKVRNLHLLKQHCEKSCPSKAVTRTALVQTKSSRRNTNNHINILITSLLKSSDTAIDMP